VVRLPSLLRVGKRLPRRSLASDSGNTSQIRFVELLLIPVLAAAVVLSALALCGTPSVTRWERGFADRAATITICASTAGTVRTKQDAPANSHRPDHPGEDDAIEEERSESEPEVFRSDETSDRPGGEEPVPRPVVRRNGLRPFGEFPGNAERGACTRLRPQHRLEDDMEMDEDDTREQNAGRQ